MTSPLNSTRNQGSIDSSWMEVESLLTESSHVIEDSSASDFDVELETPIEFQDNHISLLKKYPEMIPERFKSKLSKNIVINPVRHSSCHSVFDRAEVFQFLSPQETQGTSPGIEYFNITKGECPGCNETVNQESFKEDKRLQIEIQTFCQRVLEKHDLTIQEKKAVEIELKDSQKLIELEKSPIINKLSLTALPVEGSGKTYRKNALKYLATLDSCLVQKHIKKDATKEILWDERHRVVSILKSGKWRIYKIGVGNGSALSEHPSLNEAIKKGCVHSTCKK